LKVSWVPTPQLVLYSIVLSEGFELSEKVSILARCHGVGVDCMHSVMGSAFSIMHSLREFKSIGYVPKGDRHFVD
jgi:hypothetical protein